MPVFLQAVEKIELFECAFPTFFKRSDALDFILWEAFAFIHLSELLCDAISVVIFSEIVIAVPLVVEICDGGNCLMREVPVIIEHVLLAVSVAWVDVRLHRWLVIGYLSILRVLVILESLVSLLLLAVWVHVVRIEVLHLWGLVMLIICSFVVILIFLLVAWVFVIELFREGDVGEAEIRRGHPFLCLLIRVNWSIALVCQLTWSHNIISFHIRLFGDVGLFQLLPSQLLLTSSLLLGLARVHNLDQIDYILVGVDFVFSCVLLLCIYLDRTLFCLDLFAPSIDIRIPCPVCICVREEVVRLVRGVTIEIAHYFMLRAVCLIGLLSLRLVLAVLLLLSWFLLFVPLSFRVTISYIFLICFEFSLFLTIFLHFIIFFIRFLTNKNRPTSAENWPKDEECDSFNQQIPIPYLSETTPRVLV